MNYNCYKLLIVLFIMNDILHNVSEKIIIILFIIVLYYIIKLLKDLIEEDYKNRIDIITNNLDIIFNFWFSLNKFYANFVSWINTFFFDLFYIFNRFLKKVINKNPKIIYFRNNLNNQYFNFINKNFLSANQIY